MNITENVKGAPFLIDAIVVIGPPCDEEGLAEREGQIGEIAYFNYDCGCGQSYPHDPMIGVGFPDGKIQEFWAEELTLWMHPPADLQPLTRWRRIQ